MAYAGLSDYLMPKKNYNDIGFEAPTAKAAMNSPMVKAAKLGMEVGRPQGSMQMQVNDSEIMDPQTMALMRMGRMR